MAADANKVVEKVLPITTKDYKETRIQIRRQNGVPITQSFQADSNLSVIYDFLEKFHGLPKGTYTLSTSFPR